MTPGKLAIWREIFPLGEVANMTGVPVIGSPTRFAISNALCRESEFLWQIGETEVSSGSSAALRPGGDSLKWSHFSVLRIAPFAPLALIQGIQVAESRVLFFRLVGGRNCPSP